MMVERTDFFMKKLLIGLVIIIVLSSLNNLNLAEDIIPNEAIRFRILANSNNPYDQYIKTEVKDELQDDMYKLLKNTEEIDEARTIIKANISLFNQEINKVLEKESYPLGYKIDYGSHYFPYKEYKGIVYKEGYYESVLVTLGKGEGDNWWCVLFPPLCLLEAKKSTKVEYKFFVKELIDKFFHKH
jgi:stage II sporulation protein R